MKNITKPLLIQVLTRMGEMARDEGLTLELCLYGGALMMLAYDARTITKDVDAIIRPTRQGLAIARRAGREFGLFENWINDDVKTFLASSEQTRALPWEAPGIRLTAPTAGYLLAMKALACRQSLPGYQGDLDDLRFLIAKMGIKSVQEIQQHVDKYYPDDVIRPEHAVLLQTLIEEEPP